MSMYCKTRCIFKLAKLFSCSKVVLIILLLFLPIYKKNQEDVWPCPSQHSNKKHFYKWNFSGFGIFSFVCWSTLLLRMLGFEWEKIRYWVWKTLKNQKESLINELWRLDPVRPFNYFTHRCNILELFHFSKNIVLSWRHFIKLHKTIFITYAQINKVVFQIQKYTYFSYFSVPKWGRKTSLN